MSFLISALPFAPFQHLLAMPASELSPFRARRLVAQTNPGYPCRVSLMDAAIGEDVLLVHHEHQSADTPFRASHAIYVRQNAVQAQPQPDEVPPVLLTRVLSLRGFDQHGMLVAADLVPGIDLKQSADTMLADRSVAYIHLHFAKPGCYAARLDRV